MVSGGARNYERVLLGTHPAKASGVAYDYMDIPRF